MPPEQGAPATGAPEGARPAGAAAPESTPPASAAPPAGASGGGTEDQPLGPAGQAALAEEREARRAAERELKKLRDADAARQREGQTEAERARSEAEAARAEATSLRAQLQTTAIRTAAYEAASKLGYRSPEVAYALLDRDAIKFKESGEPENVEQQLAKLLEREPYLGKAAGGDFGGGNRGGAPAAGAPTMNDALRAIIGKG